MSSPVEDLEKFRIPLEEIKSATEEFNQKNLFAIGYYSLLYSGQLSERWENRTAAFKKFGRDYRDGKEEFLNELKFISKLKHKNIIPFLGYCHEGEEMVIVYEYPVLKNLAFWLTNPDNRSQLTWALRLLICYHAARGLEYLHSGLGQHGKVIHGSFMVDNIFFGEKFEAKICGFEISRLIPGDQVRQQVYRPHERGHIRPHMDPVYLDNWFLKVESDVYSFGVLLFNMLTRPDAFRNASTGGDRMPKSITMAVQHHFHNRLDSVIDPAIRDQIDSQSFRMIEEITFKCLSYNIKDRPTIYTLGMTIKDALEIHTREANFVKGSSSEYRNPREIRIPFKEIELAMQMSKESSLPPHVCSKLYTAELSERWPNRKVVFKIYNIVSDKHESTDRSLRMDMFLNELNIGSRFHDENIVPYIGYCDEGGTDKILVYESSVTGDYIFKEDDNSILIYKHPIKGSLHDHLQDKLCSISWEQRLKICLGAARGIKCLHSGLWEENRLVVHRQVRSENILLDENMEAKISNFGLSIFVPRNNPHVSDNYWKLAEKNIINESDASMDPIYKESYIVNTQVDVYSFGLVMFEILSGSVLGKDNDEESDLIRRVHRHYGDNEMDKLIDPNLRDQIDDRSLRTFAETAYRCLSYNIKERPSMIRIAKKIEEALYFQKHGAAPSTTTIPSQQYQKLEDLLIPFKEIKQATCDFSNEYEIGSGGFGVVYKGQLSKWPNHEVAIKRLFTTNHQGKKEFKRLFTTNHQGKKEFNNELKLIFKFHHQNIISFVGYCDEDDEMILVSQYANKGSLDVLLEKLDDNLLNKPDNNLLNKPDKKFELTWKERLKICLGAAKGLEYLHSGLGEDTKVIHRDVKSGNILLDDNLEAKICDFGLSKSGLTYDHQHSKHYTGFAGTDYYRDPVYHESGILRTESDVYSFGVVMFEMLSGLPAYRKRKIGDDQSQPLLKLVRRYYDSGKELLIDPQIKDEIDSNSFHTFIEIAYQCISFNSKERPSMETIVDKIEEALDFQVKKEASSKGD